MQIRAQKIFGIEYWSTGDLAKTFRRGGLVHSVLMVLWRLGQGYRHAALAIKSR
jgi:hypothetical protein